MNTIVSQTKKLAGMCILALALFSACSKDDDSTTNPDNTGPVTDGLKLSTNATFGSMLADGNGKTLYFFALDANGTSACTDGCALAWPVYYAGNETAPTGIVATDIATITRADGKKQTTYKGWPLYYYAGDAAKTDTKGDAVEGTWFVAKPDYSVMLANSQLVGNNGISYLANTQPGTGVSQYLTDGAGRTLYAYAPDKFNLNTYTRADLSNNTVWPIFESDVLNVPSVLRKDMFVQITSAGKKQLTYKGHPLYYFGPDAKRGDNKGVSVPAPGVWPVLTLTTAPLTP